MRRSRRQAGTPTAPLRVTVVSPQTRLALARRAGGGPRVVLSQDFDTAAARAVHRRQRRLALLSMALLALLVLGLPAVLRLLPVLDRARLGDVPVSWLLLGVLPYPLLLLLGWAHLRAAERAEARRAAGPGGAGPEGGEA